MNIMTNPGPFTLSPLPYDEGALSPVISSRTMTFRVTVRDNHAGGGGTAYTATNVASVSSAGPFVVTAPNTAGAFAGGSQQTVTWSVAVLLSGSMTVASRPFASTSLAIRTSG